MGLSDSIDLKKFDNFADKRDYNLLEKDKYTFNVLARIIGEKCDLLLTDHKRLIICFSCSPYPVWIWTADDATQEEKQMAFELIKSNSLLDGEHTYNMKYDLAEFFIEQAEGSKRKLFIKMNMLAYDCPKPIKPSVKADGKIYKCEAKDIDELTELTDFFHLETGTDQSTAEVYRKKSEEAIKKGNVYFWKNAEGENTSVCNLRINGDMASVGLVYTRKEFRKKHYAENLVYEVTKIAKKSGYTPMLYTDADYIASNACYKKIGYTLKGKICTVG